MRIVSIAPHIGTIRETEIQFKRSWASSASTLEFRTLDSGPLKLESLLDIAHASEPLLRSARAAADAGADALIIDCFLDPALEICRQKIGIPIIGPGRASLFSGLGMGSKLAVIAPNEVVLAAAKSMADLYGINSFIVAWAYLLAGEQSIHGSPAATADALRRAYDYLVGSTVCDVAVLGCTGLEPYWFEAMSGRRLPVPVLQPYGAAVGLAQLAASQVIVPAKTGEEIQSASGTGQ